MRQASPARLAWLTLLWLAAAGAWHGPALGAEADEWSLRNVRRTDYWWHRSPPRVIAPMEAERLADSLGLTEQQRTILTQLIEATTESFAGLWLECAEAYDDARHGSREDRNWRQVRREMASLRERYLGHFDRGRERVLSDLEVILTAEQQAGWDRAMRGHRRRTLLARYSNLPGEGVDLIALVELAEIESSVLAEIEPMLEDYALELDSALLARRSVRQRLERACRGYEEVDEARENTPEWRADRAEASEDVVKHALRVWDASSRIRQINERHTGLIADKLPQETRERLEVLLASAPYPGGEDRREPRGLRMLRFAEVLSTASAAYEGIASYSDSRWYTDVARVASEVEPLTRTQLREIRELREEFEQRHAQLVIEHGMGEFEDVPLNRRRVHCREGVAYLTRNEREEGRRSDRDRAEYHRALGELNDETVWRLREVLTLNQRILLQTRE